MSASRAVTLCVVATGLAMAPWFSASAVVPQLRLEWDLATGTSAWLTTAVQLGFVLGALSIASLRLADRIPSHALFAGSAALAGAATLAIAGLEVGPRGALALRLVTGAALAGVYPPAMRLAATWTTRSRGLALGAVVAAVVLGSALPHLLNATVGADGMPPWRGVLNRAGLLAVAGGALVGLFVREGPHLARGSVFEWRRVLETFSERGLRLANLGYLGHMWELYAMWTWMPVLLLESYEQAGLGGRAGRLAGFATLAIGALGSLVAGRCADRLGRTTVAAASLVVSGTCCLFAGSLLDAPRALTALCLVWGFFVVADSAQFSAAVSELADARRVGTALTLQTSLGFLLTLVSVQALPALLDAAGPRVALAWLALGPAVGTLAMLRLRALPEARRLASGRG